MLVRGWEPGGSERCALCRNTGVHGNPDSPTVHCRKGNVDRFGRGEIPLAKMLRHRFPLSFMPVERCSDYDGE
jgi:hypothetical protein